MFQKACKTFGYMEIIAFKVPPGGAKTYLYIPWPTIPSRYITNTLYTNKVNRFMARNRR